MNKLEFLAKANIFKKLAFCPFTGEVRMPSGKTARPNITDNKDGTVTVKYAPTEKGLHEMDIKYDGNHIPGTKKIRQVF